MLAGNVIDPLEVINGCTLQSLIEKIDDGNLPEKEVHNEYCNIKIEVHAYRYI